MKTKSFLLCLAVLTILTVPAMAATLSRDMPSRVDPGSDFTVKLIVPDAVAGESLTIEEALPKGVVLKTWDVSGTKESQLALRGDSAKFRVKENAYGWSLTPTGPVTVTYTATAPYSQENLNFDVVWFDKGGFNHNAFTLSVAPASASVPEAVSVSQPAEQPKPAPVPAPKPAPVAEKKSNLTWLIGLVILLLAAAAYYYFYYSEKKK